MPGKLCPPCPEGCPAVLGHISLEAPLRKNSPSLRVLRQGPDNTPTGSTTIRGHTHSKTMPTINHTPRKPRLLLTTPNLRPATQRHTTHDPTESRPSQKPPPQGVGIPAHPVRVGESWLDGFLVLQGTAALDKKAVNWGGAETSWGGDHHRTGPSPRPLRLGCFGVCSTGWLPTGWATY